MKFGNALLFLAVLLLVAGCVKVQSTQPKDGGQSSTQQKMEPENELVPKQVSLNDSVEGVAVGVSPEPLDLTKPANNGKPSGPPPLPE